MQQYKVNKGRHRTCKTVTCFAKSRKTTASFTSRCGRRYVARKVQALIKLQKIIFSLSVLFLLLFFLFAYLERGNESLICVYLFIFLWGLEKCLSWKLGFKIGIGPMVAISQNANSKLRLFGLIWGIAFASFGMFKVFETIAT
ncbi:hypothetical protein [Shewanella gelidii]|uniref:hypothetical protein n=1 Tax=Shewanella gelidii TaxID=1642821 RepID=UPI00166DE159|nr:hypothetical protein [Shewanella gelidii]MCL1098187.1 hypothetical protein [Shewanella gelidii]